MDRVDHAPPTAQRGLAEQVGFTRRIVRDRVIDGGRLGDDQAGAAARARRVIGRGFGGEHAVGGELARHRRHRHAVAQPDPGDLHGFEQVIQTGMPNVQSATSKIDTQVS